MLEKWRFERCKQVLKDYNNSDKYIRELEESIRFPHQESDLNADIKSIGKKSDGMFNTFWTIENHRTLNQIKKNQMAVSELLSECGKDTETIIRELYMRRFPRYKMDGLVDNRLISCSRSKAFKLRNDFFDELDKLL